jgi:O-antigen/teichoic acid export membrane protein
LKYKAARSSLFVGGVTFALRPLNLVVTVVLARLLAPSAFGAVALAMVLLGTTALFSGLGMGSAVVHSQAERGRMAFQAFVITLLSSTLLFVLTLTNAPLLARVLGDAGIVPILSWLALLIPLNAWPIVPAALLRKDLLYDRITYANIAAQIVFAVVAIVLAYMGLDVWSLVYAQLTSALVNGALNWILCPGWAWLKPARWDWELTRALLRYGFSTTGGSLVNYFTTHWDDWLVGRQLGTTALGFYSKAFEFTNQLVVQLSGNIVGSVFFSSYAQMQGDASRLARAYLKSVRFISLMMFPIAFGILATSSLLVPLLLGEQWLPMIPALQVYALMVLTRPISANTASIFMAVGKPEYALRAGLVLAAAMVPLVLLGLRWGIVGVAAAVVIADYFGLVYNIWRTNTILPGSAAGSLRATRPILATAVFMFGAVALARIPVVNLLGETIWALLALVVLGVLVYGVGAFLAQRALLFEIIQVVLLIVDKKGRLAPLAARLAAAQAPPSS